MSQQRHRNTSTWIQQQHIVNVMSCHMFVGAVALHCAYHNQDKVGSCLWCTMLIQCCACCHGACFRPGIVILYCCMLVSNVMVSIVDGAHYHGNKTWRSSTWWLQQPHLDPVESPWTRGCAINQSIIASIHPSIHSSIHSPFINHKLAELQLTQAGPTGMELHNHHFTNITHNTHNHPSSHVERTLKNGNHHDSTLTWRAYHVVSC